MSVTPPGSSAGQVTTVVVVDDQAMFRAGVRGILQGAADLSVVGEAVDGDTGERMCASLRLDGVRMDLRMPVLDGIEAIQRLRSMPDPESPRILVLTAFDDAPTSWRHCRRALTGSSARSPNRPSSLTRSEVSQPVT